MKVVADDIYEEFRNHGIPIEKLLPRKMRWIAEQPEWGESFIIVPIGCPNHGLNGCQVIGKGKNLNQEQLHRISNLILDPRSYWVFNPVWYRLPPKCSFVVRLHREQHFLDVMMSLKNEGWAFFHSAGHYICEWNWVGAEKRQLAHELFPEYAPKSPDSAWRKGTIKHLKDKLYQKQKTNNK